ncbi:MAG TPA: primosomal protein N' [Bacteroidia bacterium]|nr:primosomal protein N' [Bacteroidia bacterium]
MDQGTIENKDMFADVIIPIPVPNLFTYRIPPEYREEVRKGVRVVVPFGKQKIYSALVRKVHPNTLSENIKDIQGVLDKWPIVNELQFEFWDWIEKYYMCFPGEVMNAALPSAFKLQSETSVIINPEFDPEQSHLTDEEFLIFEILQSRDELSLQDVSGILKKKNVYRILNLMLAKGAVYLSEEIEESYRPKLESRIVLSSVYNTEKALEDLFLQLDQDKRKQKQLESLMIFLKFLYADKEKKYVKKTDLRSDPSFSDSSLNTLIKNNVLEEQMVRVDRISSPDTDKLPLLKLNEMQEKAHKEVLTQWKTKEVVYIHGVTSSGKTEVYIHLIEEALKAGKQVLYLLPEIALTTQIITRLRKHFGNTVGVYHSRYSNNERVEIWNNVLAFNTQSAGGEKAKVVLGARSALLLPFSNLGLIVVDEEHDASYKQTDPAPRYHARDAAIVLAGIHGAKVVLGSATPSLESYYNAQRGRYGLVNMKERFGGMLMPSIVVADIREAKRKRIMKSHFTPELMQSISNALVKKEQVILFQNRRGFSPYLECNRCAWIPHCKNCSVTLTYHKSSHQIKCHYCGYLQAVPSTCQQCGDHQIEVRGFGTEKIEEEIAVLFPEARIARMDLDATRTKNAFQKIIAEFEERKIDILVGTQMVTKGLDFDNVSTVGIINADQLLNFPDFRSFERSFQLMAQVSGRSGRKQKQGNVVIQTQQPDHWVITDVVKNDYLSFFNRDLEERRKFSYPPHSRLIEITLKHRDKDLLDDAAGVFAGIMIKKLGKRVYGPHIPIVSRIKNLYLKLFLIKIERDESSTEAKRLVKEGISQFFLDKTYQRVILHIDVDPM